MSYIPTIYTTQGSHERVVDTPNYLYENNRGIWIEGEINGALALHVSSAIMALDQQGDDDIKVYINSPGGSISDGMCIVDTMNLARSDIVTVAYGMAASMGAVILAAGTKGKRYAMPNSEIMIHQPLTGAQGAASDIDIVARRILGKKQKIAEFFAEASGQTVKTILKYMDRDTWFTAEEACSLGLCDAVCTELPY